jgi:hypothetical protein
MPAPTLPPELWAKHTSLLYRLPCLRSSVTATGVTDSLGNPRLQWWRGSWAPGTLLTLQPCSAESLPGDSSGCLSLLLTWKFHFSGTMVTSAKEMSRPQILIDTKRSWSVNKIFCNVKPTRFFFFVIVVLKQCDKVRREAGMRVVTLLLALLLLIVIVF